MATDPEPTPPSADPSPSLSAGPPASGPGAGAPEGPAKKGPHAAVPVNKRSRGLGKSPLERLGWVLVLAATTLVVVLGIFILVLQFSFVKPDMGPPALDEAYVSQADNFSIRPPLHWGRSDQYPVASVVIKGPEEHGFSPLIMVALDIAPGRLDAYVKEHKTRLEREERSVQWLSEQEDWIDGCRAMRLEYQTEYQEPDRPKGTVRALQYILEDQLRFYRITCFVNAEFYEKYVRKFEASARSFHRTPLPKMVFPPVLQTP